MPIDLTKLGIKTLPNGDLEFLGWIIKTGAHGLQTAENSFGILGPFPNLTRTLDGIRGWSL